MNKVILIGRLAKDPEVRTSENGVLVAKYSLAVSRRYVKDGEQSADFLPCVTFSKGAEFAEKYLRKGMRIAVSGRLVTGSYMNKEGQRIHTTTVILDSQEFADGKPSGNGPEKADEPQYLTPPQYPADEDFVTFPEGDEEDFPFS